MAFAVESRLLIAEDRVERVAQEPAGRRRGRRVHAAPGRAGRPRGHALRHRWPAVGGRLRPGTARCASVVAAVAVSVPWFGRHAGADAVAFLGLLPLLLSLGKDGPGGL